MTDAADPRAEVLDIVDEDDRVVGRATRGEAYARGLRHRTVMVVVRDPAGRVLVHRRAATKLTAPSMHDMMIGGVVGAGESYDACAAREVEEEIGAKDVPLRRAFAFRLDAEEVDAPPDLLVPSQWITVYETTWDGPVVPQESEIDWWDWLDEVELERRVEAGEPAFCPDSVVAWRRLREPPRSRSTDGEPGPRS